MTNQEWMLERARRLFYIDQMIDMCERAVAEDPHHLTARLMLRNSKETRESLLERIENPTEPKPGRSLTSRLNLISEKTDGHCGYCGVLLERSEWTLDHIVPKSRKGTGEPENLVLACHSCNCEKGSLLLAEFRAVRGVDEFPFETEVV